MIEPTRRDLLVTVTASLLVGALAQRAWADDPPAQLHRWLRDAIALKRELRAGRLSVTLWQAAMQELNAGVDIADLTRALDVDRLTQAFDYNTPFANAADVPMPPEIAGTDRWFIRIFGMRRDSMLLPHIHNNMVSAHLVLSGRLRVTTHDRVRDLPNATVLRPSRDETLSSGGALTMSDQRDNHHWLRAQADRTLTIDVGIQDVPASFPYHLSGDATTSTVLIDPTRPPERDGTIIAPVLTLEQATTRFTAA